MTRQAITLKVLFIMLFCWSHFVYALAPIPPIGRVVDTTQTLTFPQKAHLTSVLQQFETAKGSQIAIVVVNSTEPETIEQYSIRVAQQWQLGRKKIDDGALLVVAMQDRTMRIEVGYGLEGALNDAVCKRIISEIITPYFKKGQYYEGISNGVNQMIKTINGEPLPAPKHQFNSHGNIEVNGDSIPWIIFLAVMASMLLRSIFGNTLEKKMLVASFVSILISFGVWLLTVSVLTALGAGALAFIFSLLDPSQGGRGGWGSGGGSGGFGGSSGGGFSGGGGSFGGGGSSGRW